ncbi:MAG: hypoxanthine/guanine phosphoribosyltransferase [Candidatus Thermoplasmatota archaeon]|nr:hypoxanthine/guanine phosphoribosyltransferase [Candidatus Thermoplasmatota archaeon]MEC8265083.1 hypoxanthine/guanine phosphoribosyltransferase [Candidatus Thermoplasmatota archaeon]MEC9205461.1 hypoxanthine/guanine phosphoribosyltransferase [Candidatus Thermoplasmatota archaeon]
MQRLSASLESAPIVWKDGYPYFVHPVTDGVPRLEGEVLSAIVHLIGERVAWDDVDLILGIEAMGLPLTAPLSVQHDRPLVVARKRAYGLEGEVVVDQSTGYSKGAMYLNDVRPGERVLIVDDVLSTGGTLRAVIDGIRRCGAEVAQVVIVVEKGPGMADLHRDDPSLNLSALIAVDVVDGRVVTRPATSMA